MNGMTELAGKVAVVTGATSGLGMAVARALDAKGVKLVLTGRRQERLDRLAGELSAALTIPGDITDPGLPDKLVETALEVFGRLDIAFNNAGLLATGTIEDTDLERVTQMVRVNVEAAFRVAFTVLRQFKAQGSGHLVNTSSIAGTKVRAGIGAYAGTKHAIEALAHSLRLELADTPIRISNIQPGLVETEIFDHLPPEKHPKGQQGIKEPLVPDDIARAVVFMLEQPPHVLIPAMLVKPTDQAL